MVSGDHKRQNKTKREIADGRENMRGNDKATTEQKGEGRGIGRRTNLRTGRMSKGQVAQR